MSTNKTFNKVQLDVKFTQATSRANLTSEENISISFGKLSKWYTSLVPTGGSSGQFLGWNSDGTAKWVSNPNSDTYDRNRYRANIKAGTSALVAANIIVGKDGVFNHLKSGGSFDISYPILYLNEAVAAEGTTKNSYDIINFTITTTQSISLTSYLPVFIKGTLSGKIFTPVSTAPLTQTVPTTDDGYQYMYLGNATSTSAVYLTERHPIYVFKNGVFGEIINYSANAGSVAWGDVSGKPSTFAPASGSDYYVKNLTGSSRSTATTKSWVSMCNSSQTGAPTLPTSGKWWHVLSLDCWNGAPNNWVSQLALPTQDDSSIYYRKNPSSGTSIESGTWIKVLDSNNYTSYTVKKDGTGATGSWDISITGNATSATKATQDESGNNIKATYAASFSISDHTITLKNKNGTSLGTVTVPDDDTWIAMVGATSSADGSVGYVNAIPPKNGYNTKYLRADGTWAIPPGTYSHPTYTERSKDIYKFHVNTLGHVDDATALDKTDVSTLINKLDTGSSTPVDADYYISQYVGGGTTTTSYHRRPMSALWSYVKSKADSVYLPIGHTYPLSIAADSGTNQLTLSASTKYKLTAGGSTFVFTTPSDTKNTAGSTDTSSKIFLIGATSQAANPQTYSDNEVYTTSGVLTTKKVQVGGGHCTMEYNSTTETLDFVFT